MVPSARWMAIILGTCSPSVMWRKVIRMNAVATAALCEAMPCQLPGSIEERRSKSRAKAGSPGHPSPRLATVIPIWAAEMNRLGSSMARSTARASRFPSAAICSMRVRRAETSANSAATKMPFARIRRKTEPRRSHCSRPSTPTDTPHVVSRYIHPMYPQRQSTWFARRWLELGVRGQPIGRSAPQLAQCLALDLTHALPADVELLAHFRQRMRRAVTQPEAELQHQPLARRQFLQHLGHIALEQRLDRFLLRRARHLIGDEIGEGAFLVLTDRLFERNRALGGADKLLDLLRRDAHRLGHLLGPRRAAKLLRELHHRPAVARDAVDHVDRQPDGAALVGYGTGDRLADPPGRVRAKAVPPAPVILLDRPDQTEVALLDQVQQREPTSHVALGDADHEPQVRADEALERLDVALLDALGQLHLFLRREQRRLRDVAEVETDRIGRQSGVVLQQLIPVLIESRCVLLH